MTTTLADYLLSVADEEPLATLHQYFVMTACDGNGGGRFYTPDWWDAVVWANDWATGPVEKDCQAIVYEKWNSTNQWLSPLLRERRVDDFFGLPLYMPLVRKR